MAPVAQWSRRSRSCGWVRTESDTAATPLSLWRSGIASPRADATLEELFGRITFNILCSNTDDHPRNHAAFWNGRDLSLTPAYDISPGLRNVGEVEQAMAIGRDGWRYSQLAGCISRCSEYHLEPAQARAIVDRQVETIRENWDEVCDDAGLTKGERDTMFEGQFLNPFAFETSRS